MSKEIGDTYLPITIERQELVYQGFRQVITYAYREDESGLAAQREIVHCQDAVAVIAHDPQLERLVMIRQFRLGAQLGAGKGMEVEIAAGLIDAGERPEEAAIRELREETGLDALHIKPMCSYLTSPGVTDEVLHLFYAQVDASSLASEAGHQGESEQTFPFLITYDQAMQALDENAIGNGIALVGLMWFARHRESLLREAI